MQSFDLRVIDDDGVNDPPVIAAPPSRVLFGQEFVHQLEATDPENDAVTFSLIDGPDGLTMDDAGLVRWKPASHQLTDIPHDLIVEAVDARGASSGQVAFPLTVLSQRSNQRPYFTTNPGTNTIVGVRYEYDADAQDDDHDSLAYRLVQAPPGMTIDVHTGLVEWTPGTDQIGQHDVVVRVTDTYGAGLEQLFTITTRTLNLPPSIESVPPTSAVSGEAYTYSIRTSDPEDDHVTLAVAAADANGAPVAGVDLEDGVVVWDNPVVGNYEFTVTASDEQFAVLQVYPLVVSDSATTDVDSPPFIDSTPPPLASLEQDYSYQVYAGDPDGDEVTLSLDADSLARGMEFNTENPFEILWPKEALILGTYPVTVTATANGRSFWQRYDLQVLPKNNAPTIDPAAPLTVTAGRTYHYDVQAEDDDNDLLHYELKQAPEGMTIDQYGRVEWKTTPETELKEYPVEILVTDGRGGEDFESFTLRVVADTEDPVVAITLDPPQVAAGRPAKIIVSATDNVGVTGITLMVDGEPVPVDGSGIAMITKDVADVYHITATAVDAAGRTGRAPAVDLNVFDPTSAPPTAVLLNPEAGATITEPIDIRGQVLDTDSDDLAYTLTATPLDGGRTIELGSGAGSYDGAVLGRLDTTRLADGAYQIVLSATADGRTVTDARVVHVDAGLKLGRMTVSFVDLQIPVAGLPITVTRSYDSLRADHSGDFGYGWSLDFSNTKLQTILPPDTQPGLYGYKPFRDGARVVITLPDGSTEGFTFYGAPATMFGSAVFDYLPRFVPDVGVTSELIVNELSLRKTDGEYADLESGHRYNPADPLFGNAYLLRTRSGLEYAINATTGDLASVTDRHGNTLHFTGDGISHSSGRGITFERDDAGRITAIIDPAGRRLEYDYDAHGNLVRFRDRAQTAAGDGTATEFFYRDDPAHYLEEIRDPFGRPAAQTEYDDQGRVRRVTDSDGKVIEYAYDAGQKTQTVTDQLGHVTTLTFDARGNIIRELDPAGGLTLRRFDNEDRLLEETIVIGAEDTDANGEDDDLTTVSTYDETTGDLLTTTDPRGNVTVTTYHRLGGAETVSTPGGGTQINGYDDTTGLLVSVSQAASAEAPDVINTTRFGYDGSNLTEVRNADNTLLVTNTYNAFGDVTATFPASGRATYFDYNLNGDQIATWYFDGAGADRVQVLDLTDYDENRRVTGTRRAILPDGQFLTENLNGAVIPPEFLRWSTQTVYNPAGQVVSTTDRFGLVSQSLYDVRGQLIETRRQSVDLSGAIQWLVTRTVYDAAGRAVVATDEYVEGTQQSITGTRTTYDAMGRVTQTESLRGIRIRLVGAEPSVEAELLSAGTVLSTSTTEYDPAGRVTLSTDRFGNETRFTYNRFGETVETRVQTKDAAGALVERVTRTVYDDYGRVVLTTDPYVDGADGPVLVTRTVYDELGRGHRTLRLSGVTISLVDGETALVDAGTTLWETRTVYDDQGRVRQSLAADGQVTDYEYDAFGRRIAVIAAPVTLAGQTVRLRTETEYDAEGRVAAERTNIRQVIRVDGTVEIDRTDERTTTFSYDAFGNRVRTTFTDGTVADVAYDAFGRPVAETVPYDPADPRWQTDPVPAKRFEYDAQGRLTAVELPAVLDPETGEPARPRYEYGYDAQGRQTLVRDPLGRETRFTFDSQGRQLSRTLPLGFGDDGRQGTGDDDQVSPGDFTERFAYDEQGWPVLHVSFEDVVMSVCGLKPATELRVKIGQDFGWAGYFPVFFGDFLL